MDIPIIERTLTHLSASFDEFGIPYYLTGSLAVRVYGKPGQSQKIEVVADVKLSQVSALVAWLDKQYAVCPVSAKIDRSISRKGTTENGGETKTVYAGVQVQSGVRKLAAGHDA